MVWIDSDYAATLTPSPSVTGGLGSGAGQNNPGYSAPTYPPQTYGPTQPTRQYAPSADPNGQYYSDDGGATWLWEDFPATGDADMGIGGSVAQMPGYGMGFQSNPPYEYQDPGLGYETTRADDVYPSADPGFEWRRPGGSGDDAWQMFYTDPNYNPNWYQDAYREWADQPMPQQNRVGRAGMQDQFATVGEAYNDWTRGEQASDYRSNTAMPTPMWGSGDPEVAQWQGNPQWQQPSQYDVPLEEDSFWQQQFNQNRNNGGWGSAFSMLNDPFGIAQGAAESGDSIGGFSPATTPGEGFSRAMYPFDYLSEIGGSVTDAQLSGLNQARHGDIWGGTGTSLGGFSEAYGDLTNPNEAVGEFRDRPGWQQFGYGALFDPTIAIGGVGALPDVVRGVRRAGEIGDIAGPAMRGLGQYGSDVMEGSMRSIGDFTGLGPGSAPRMFDEGMAAPKVPGEGELSDLRTLITERLSRGPATIDEIAQDEAVRATGAPFMAVLSEVQLADVRGLINRVDDVAGNPVYALPGSALPTPVPRDVPVVQEVTLGREFSAGLGATGQRFRSATVTLSDGQSLNYNVPIKGAKAIDDTSAAGIRAAARARAESELGIPSSTQAVDSLPESLAPAGDFARPIEADVPDSVSGLTASLRQKYPGVDVLVLDTSGRTSGRKVMDVASVIVGSDGRSQGTGTRILREITEWADAHDYTVTLNADPTIGGVKGTRPNIKRLTDWYEQFGFVRNTGRNMDYELSSPMTDYQMVRQPKPGKPQRPVKDTPDVAAAKRAPIDRPSPDFPMRGDRVVDKAGNEGTIIRGSNTGPKAPMQVKYADGSVKVAARSDLNRVYPELEGMTVRELAREINLPADMRQQLILLEARVTRGGATEEVALLEAVKRRLAEAASEDRAAVAAKPRPTVEPKTPRPPKAKSEAELSVVPESRGMPPIADRPGAPQLTFADEALSGAGTPTGTRANPLPTDSQRVGVMDPVPPRDAPSLTFADEAIIGGKPPPPGRFDSSVPPSSPHWRPTKDGLVTLLGEIINLPRALLSSMDISAGGRQGIIYAFSRPKQWSAAWKPAFQSMMSNKRAILLDHALDARPNARIQREAGLYRAPVDNRGVKLADREEHFMSSWVGKIPLVGATQRHYVTFLNTLRATVFDAKWNSLDPLQQTAENAKELARVINSATGRGPRLTTDGIAPVVNGALFSERNLTAKFSLINQAVGAGTTGMGPARQEALRALLGFTAGNIALLGTLKAAGLIDVELDPRSADFGKMRIGPARYDLGGGYLQLIRYGAQILSGERKDSYGEIQSADRWDTFGKFGRSKLSPTAGEAVNQIGGKDFMGEDIDNSPLGIARRLLVPLSPEDIDQARREFGIEAALWMLPTLVGIGTQYYESAPEARDRFAKDWAETNGITTTDGRTITKFDDLNAGQQREVRARMKDGQEPREPNLGNEYEQSAHSKRLKEEAYARLEGELKNYITADAAKPVLKEQIQDFKKQRYTASQTAYSESQKAGFPDSDKPEDLLAEMYWSAPVGTDYKTGRLDFSEQERIRADVLAKAREQGIDPNYITGDGPLTFRGQRFADPDVRQAVKEYEDAQKLVSGSGIWDIKDKTWGDLKATAPADLGAYQTFDDFREAYIQLLIPEYTKAGMNPAVARTQAENKVGGFPVTKRYYDLVNAQEMDWMLKNPGAATAAVEWGWWEPTKKQAGASIGVIR